MNVIIIFLEDWNSCKICLWYIVKRISDATRQYHLELVWYGISFTIFRLLFIFSYCVIDICVIWSHIFLSQVSRILCNSSCIYIPSWVFRGYNLSFTALVLWYTLNYFSIDKFILLKDSISIGYLMEWKWGCFVT